MSGELTRKAELITAVLTAEVIRLFPSTNELTVEGFWSSCSEILERVVGAEEGKKSEIKKKIERLLKERTRRLGAWRKKRFVQIAMVNLAAYGDGANIAFAKAYLMNFPDSSSITIRQKGDLLEFLKRIGIPKIEAERLIAKRKFKLRPTAHPRDEMGWCFK